MSMSVIFLILVAAAAAYTDLKERKIPNWLTGAGTTSGLVISIAEQGTGGLYQASAGFAAGFGIMLLLHLCGALGAGDVKLFGAIGAVGGPWLTLSIAMYSVLFAGLIGLTILVYKKQLVSRGASVLMAVFGVVCLQRLDGLTTYRSKREMLQFPFLLAVLPGLAAALWETRW